MRKIIFLLLFLLVLPVKAEEIDWDYIWWINQTIETKCFEHSWADELYFDDNMWVRCSLILQWITQFETDYLRAYRYNNIFNFKAPSVKKEWEEIWVTWTKNWFLVFDNVESSIEFAVNRFYRFERYKTIKQIVAGGCYTSPVDWKYKCFDWYTINIKDRPNYIKFLKKYYKNNLKNYD